MAGLRGCLQGLTPSGKGVNQTCIRGILAALSPFSNSLHPWRNPLQFFTFGLGRFSAHSHPVGIPFVRSGPDPLSSSSGLQFLGVPNLSLKSDPACIAFRSLSAFRYPGSARRLGAGVAA
jgi:hypothetical protein